MIEPTAIEPTEAPEPLLAVRDLVKHFTVRQGIFEVLRRTPARRVRAVDGVSLELYEGQTLGLVGESGCGKSTLGRLIIGLLQPDSGEVLYEGKNLVGLKGFSYARKMQMVFQNPYSSLNPRKRAADAIGEVLHVHGIGAPADRSERARELLRSVGLSRADGDKYPGELSGGQRQRVGIARALAVGPRLLIADEPVSALDVSVQAQILKLLLELRESLRLTMLFISHDLRVVRHLSDAVAVMYLGQIVEQAPTRELFRAPLHPYTRGLIGAVPVVGAPAKPDTLRLEGELPSAIDVPAGCRFQGRCPFKVDRCAEEAPPLREITKDHRVACHLADKSA